MEQISRARGVILHPVTWCAFSLIELLISLIIISLLIGAFAPIITKKLKAADVTVGSFTDKKTEDDTTKTSYSPESQKDCDPFNALFISKENNDGFNNVCVTKFNTGDPGGTPLASIVKTTTVGGGTCSDKYCCWKGNTANPSKCTVGQNGDSAYSGCNRTLCNWYAADISCSEWAPNGSLKGSWRLPKQEEVDNWAKILNSEAQDNPIISRYKGKNGLQLTSKYAFAGYDTGDCNNGFNGAKNNGHNCSYHLWTSGTYPHGAHVFYAIGDNNIFQYVAIYPNLSTATILECYSDYMANSGRCVLDKGLINKPNGGNQEEKPQLITEEPQSQADCDKLTAIFIDKAYSGAGRNVCVSKYNANDTVDGESGPSIPENYQKYIVATNANPNCPSAGNCCWTGNTGRPGQCGTVGNADANYSGCNRTVCGYNVALDICKMHTANGLTKAGYWRLPTLNEAKAWQSNANIVNNNKGKNGLQLCTSDVTAGHVQCNLIGSCVHQAGVYLYCHPYNVWTSTKGSNGNDYHVLHETSTKTNFYFETASVRCVYDGLDHSDE